jgi:choline dehydrogenase-like flavoprotein
MAYYPLREARLRFFGGATNIWGGRRALLQPIDFEHRDWVPHSGWPLRLADLEPHLRAAHAALDLGDYVYDESLWSTYDCQPPAFSPELFTTSFWRFDKGAERFGAQAKAALATAPNCQLFLRANVTHLQAEPDAQGLRYVQAQSLGGRVLRVLADNYILACGAIENARLLLASNDVQSQGVGNDSDQVGRYFMEHPHARLATLEGQDAYRLWSAFRKRFSEVPTAPVLLPSAQLQQREQILNTAVTFKLQRPLGRGTPLNRRLYLSLKHQLNPTRSGRVLWQSYRSAKSLLQRYVRDGFERRRAALGLTGLHVMVRAEQAPNPRSRVRLSNTRDALGLPQADLDWQLNGQDKRTLEVLARVLGAEFERLGLGQLQPCAWLDEPSLAWPVDSSIGNHPIGGYHHMGTTRMSTQPSQGVVDADARVHGYRNLYVAGSSIFPTGGWANPTLTLLALGHRLGEHLLRRE